MTLQPCESRPSEMVLEQPNHRAAGIARALGARKLRRLGKVRYFLNARQAAQFSALYAAGFWAVRGGAATVFKRDPNGLDLYSALSVCREPVCGLTVNTSNPSTD